MLLTMLLLVGFLALSFGNSPITLQWEVGHKKSKESTPEKFVPATVPGAVQLDIARAEQYAPYYFADHWKDYLWMEDVYWEYKTEFAKPALEPGEKLFFVSKGIDYEFDIVLNGETLFYQEGMFTHVSLDLTNKLKENNQLRVILYPAPKDPSVHFPDRNQARESVKPAVSYTWDWHPRLIPLGIWDDTYLEIRQNSHIAQSLFEYNLAENLKTAELSVTLQGNALQGKQIRWKILQPSGKEVFNQTFPATGDRFTATGNLSDIELWWPHDHGTPSLYRQIIELLDEQSKVIQTLERKTGFRRTRLVMSQGAWTEPILFPKSRSVAPIQLEINGRNIFAKGSNWVNPDIFPGIITRETYRELVELAVEANFNIFRIWGGGIINKESFFEACDELGIMVWEDFPLACNKYPDTPEYLSILKQEATSIILRLKQHPSLVMWCGGNELFNNWSLMTDQSLPLRLLNSLTLELDPNTPFIMTSPIFGMGHGNYVFRSASTGEEVYQLMKRANNTAYTEFGMPSASPVDILKSIIPENELWPPKPGTSWETHHAFNAWEGETWLMPEMLASYFGPADNLEALVEQSNIIQAEGYKAIYEEARRQKPYCAMALNWCYNEPWPSAANNSIINYPIRPKPGFYAVKAACRPVMASARNEKFSWNEGESFTAELWMLNDQYKKIEPVRFKIYLISGEEKIEILTWDVPLLSENTNLAGPTLRCKLPRWKAPMFTLSLESEEHPEYNSSYQFVYKPLRYRMEAGAPMMNR